MELLGLSIRNLKNAYCISTVSFAVLNTSGAYLLAVMPGMMIVSYEPLVTSLEKIIRTITQLGYKVKKIVQHTSLTQILDSMKTLKFKTNIKCAGCLAKVSPNLNETAGEDNWEVDIQTPEKILTVASDDMDEDTIVSAVKEAGFNAERIN